MWKQHDKKEASRMEKNTNQSKTKPGNIDAENNSEQEQDVTEGKQQTKIASNRQTSERQAKTIKPNSQSAHIPLQLNFNSIWIIKLSKPHHCRLNASTIITG